MTAQGLPDPDLRLLGPDDIAAADELRQLAGWNQRPSDWLRLLEYEPRGCFAAWQDDRIIGTVTTTCYDSELAWIGMMLVHPDYRRQGWGTRLMRQALRYLENRSLRCVMLDATPAGAPVYHNLGFVPTAEFYRWQRTAPSFGPVDAHRSEGSQTSAALSDVFHGQALHSDDLQLDRQAFGADRRNLLQRMAVGAERVLRFQAADGRGYGLVRQGSRAWYLGPVTATSADAGRTLIEALLRGIPSPVYWDVPPGNRMAELLAQDLGFERLRPLTRMCYGVGRVAADLTLQYALADPATG